MSSYERWPQELDPELAQAFDKLNEDELWWMERSDFLESRGYQLRPRFRPGWVPSWKATGQDPMECEDSRFHMVRAVMDATRLSDGRQVALKAVRRGGHEVKILSMLTSPNALKNPMNHCVPILDCFGDPRTLGPDYLVMPLLHVFDDPTFCGISEIVDFVQQTLEGLVYIHQHGVAHRDLSGPNIMVDATALYPDGVHPDPFWNYLQRNKFVSARQLKRSKVGVKYYFVDFGISSYFDDPLKPRLVTGIDGIDREVPERHLINPYDPFPVDVFALGNTYKCFFAKYRNLNFLSPLVEEMTKCDPEERPTAEEALALFFELIEDVPQSSLTRRLSSIKEPILAYYIYELSLPLKSIAAMMCRVFPKRTFAFATIIPIGISVFVLLRSNHRVFERIRNLFLGVRETRI